MLSRIREQVGSAGLIVAVVALIAALAGGAYAASGGLTGQQKKQVEKIAKKHAGKDGKEGAAGAPGPTGPQGVQGSQGAKGDKGDPGTNGTNGTNGKSVVVIAADEITQCVDLGGVVVEKEGEPASAKEICTGKEGKEGPEGQFGKKPLQPGVTQTGTWAVTDSDPSAANEVLTAISFPQPLENPMGGASGRFHFQFIDANFGDFDGAGPGTVGCEGDSVSPSAPSTHLCVYVGEGLLPTTAKIRRVGAENAGVDRHGAILKFEYATVGSVRGSWAVTG